MRTKQVVALFWVVLCPGLLSCFSQSSPSRQQQIEAHAHKATEYLKENEPELAALEFRAIVALDPNLKPTLWKIQALLGIGEKRTGDIDAGRHDLENAFPKVQDQKIRIDTGMELVEIYSGTGDLDKAGAIVSVLRKLDPANEAVLYTAYRIYSDLAAESLLSLSVVDPNSARMHQAIAHELAKRGNIAEAIEHYRAALKIDPRLPGLHFELADMLGTLSTAEGRKEAESEYKAALEANPLDEQAECKLGDIALQRDDLKEANGHYTRALQLQPSDPEASIGMAKVFMTMDQPQKAEQLLQHALQLDPTSAVAHFRLSTVYRQTGRTAEAKHELEEYQKYKQMKDKLREIYHDLHQQQATDENDEANSKK
jgi:tetratricopeptide (TPR) repeat protein